MDVKRASSSPKPCVEVDPVIAAFDGKINFTKSNIPLFTSGVSRLPDDDMGALLYNRASNVRAGCENGTHVNIWLLR